MKRSSEKYKSIDKWGSFVLFLFLFNLFKRLPPSCAFRFGQLLGSIVFYCFPSRRKIVINNLERLKKWLFENEVKLSLMDEGTSSLSKKVFKRNFGNLLAAFSLSTRSRDRIEKYIDFDSLNVVQNVLDRGQGAIILFPHMGPWELMSIFGYLFQEGSGTPIEFGALYRPLNNFYLDRWLRSERALHGLKLFSKDDGFLKIVRFLKKPSVLLVSHDQRMREGRQVPFFGEMASTSNLFYSLYKMSKVPILSFSLFKVSDPKGLKWKFKFYELATSSDQNVDELTFLRRSNALLEQVILDSPIDYFFFQNRH